MNKSELAEALASATNTSKSDALRAVNALFDPDSGIIATTARSGDKVSLQGFGSFVTKERKARVGINPKTKEKVNIAAKKVVKFSASPSLAG